MRLMNETRGTCVAELAEEARGPWRRFAGLMLQPTLPPGRALYFAGTRCIHTHFMRFALDLVFVDRDLKVVRVVRNLRPWRFSPWVRTAWGVLELPAGRLPDSRTTEGDQLCWREPDWERR
ncbi:MAG TPA: DUF192 domain-containing protein [Armatimonadota bacterium]|jgi:hypothetical protein